MVRSIQELQFNHFVVATTDGTIFASARDSKNRIQNFLISRYGEVKQQVKDRFEPLSEEIANYIRKRAQDYYSIVPIYKIKAIELS